MADIKLTLSANPTMRSPSIAEEARWLEKEGALYYQLQGKPLRAAAGCTSFARAILLPVPKQWTFVG
jgi:hypothetical protein